jgi:hypothetical protein
LDYRNKLVLAPMVRTGSCELSLYAWGSVGWWQCPWYACWSWLRGKLTY